MSNGARSLGPLEYGCHQIIYKLRIGKKEKCNLGSVQDRHHYIIASSHRCIVCKLIHIVNRNSGSCLTFAICKLIHMANKNSGPCLTFAICKLIHMANKNSGPCLEIDVHRGNSSAMDNFFPVNTCKVNMFS